MQIFLFAALVACAYAACNPLKSSDCPADKALGTSIKETFSEKSSYFPIIKSEAQASFGDDGLTLSIKKRFDNPSFKSDFYLMFGKVEVEMQAAEGQGIVSSFYLQSDDLDEIDIELLGGDDTQFQSNYFSKGNVETYDRGEFHTVRPNPLKNFHTYTIDWSKDKLTWSLDGNVVRTLLPNNPEGYPETPMYIMAGIWAGGDASNDPGTIEWAGGSTTYGPTYSMHIKSVIVTDYSTGDKYLYSDQSGDWQSIKAENGKVNGRADQADADFEKLQLGGTVATGNKDTSGSKDSESSSESTSETAKSTAKSTAESTKSSTKSSTSKATSSSESTSEKSSTKSDTAKSSGTKDDKKSSSSTSYTTTYPKFVITSSRPSHNGTSSRSEAPASTTSEQSTTSSSSKPSSKSTATNGAALMKASPLVLAALLLL